MEININCDLGEKSKFHSTENDPELLNIVNSANIACGYHAGDEETMNMVIKISKSNSVSIGAHPSFNDPENFGRKKINLSASEITKLIVDQYEILQKIAEKHKENVTHIKPHGALNNMACEDIELANTVAKAINSVDKNIIFLVPTGSKMEIAAKKLNMKGTNFDYFSNEAKNNFFNEEYQVTNLSDRMGMRLEGPKLENIVNTNIKSEGLVKGVVQVPADGNPIIMFSDHGSIGGYPKIAVVITADHDKAARCS